MYRVLCPIYLPQTKKKNFALNLNIYRNAHFLVLNKMKILFKEKIQKQLDLLPTMNGVKLTYTLFMGTNREMDLSNVCVIVDKFFCDALVEAGKLEDDNFKYLASIDYRFGGIDPQFPRCEVMLEPTSIKEDNTMRIFLVQNEIEEALRNYISEQMSVADGKDFDIKLAATRGEEGFTAEINIVDKVEENTPAKKTRGPRKAVQVEESLASAELPVSTDDAASYQEDDGNGNQAEADEQAVAEDPSEAVPAFLKRKSIFGNNDAA